MAKKVYGIVGYENKGKEYTRSTDREYTHAVVLKHNEENHHVAGYCGRLELALKLKGTYEKHFFQIGKRVDVLVCETYRIK